MFPERCCSHQRLQRETGVTLLELLIVVAAVAVLSAVALPAYQNSVRKAHRADAKTALTTAAQRMERHFTEKGTYASATIGTGLADTVLPDSENKYYLLSFNPASTVVTYTLRATPQGAQAADKCGAFTIDQSGTRGVTGGSLTVEECW
ncbi:MAG: type IV pilin protein [Burkholderiaceae bacterium]|nr:type IV pilin protein [Burkholderiaceae bacterium]